MAGRRAPTAVVLAMVICGLVVAAAITGAAVLRVRAAPNGPAAPSTSEVAAPPGPITCRREPCQVLGTATVGGTVVQLIADSGANAGRLRIAGAASAEQVIELSVTDLGVTLTTDSLQCVPGTVSACLVRGVSEKGTTGQVVAGRSDKWSPLGRAFFSEANYLTLANVQGDSTPEVIAVQQDCSVTPDCSKRSFYVQVFGLGGQELGCTRTYPKIDQLPGYPGIVPLEVQLRGCP
ncbi:hypothetical protein [Actinokineospora enzanensis]|uniref:hypothetical protein n=1 Tax=Actinokineospora enzanensis TaxID=155975 RepID=UPI000378B703|nr:hypothetical protein [Actinokineospora enzanensis]